MTSNVKGIFNQKSGQGLLSFLLCKFDEEDLSYLFSEKGLYAFAKEHDLAGIISHCVAETKSWEFLPDRWVDLHEADKRRISSYLAEVDRLAHILDNDNIPVIGLKNVGIARGIHECAGCCPMGDVDLFVQKEYFREAHRILIEEGYQFEFRSPLEEADLENAERSGGAEYWKMLPEGEKLWLEMQWRPIAGRWLRPDQEPTAEELFSHSLAIPGTEVRLLSPEDNLLQVALHTAKHTYVRAPGFRLHLDVKRIVEAYPDLNWDLFLERVKTLQVQTPVYFSLLIPSQLLKVSIPDRVLNELEPPIWKKVVILRWLNRVGLFDPDGRKFSRVGFLVFNILLYDSFGGFVRSVFPQKNWMKERFDFEASWKLPYFYLKRLYNLTFRHINI